jgi:hypothetical protein
MKLLTWRLEAMKLKKVRSQARWCEARNWRKFRDRFPQWSETDDGESQDEAVDPLE